MIDLSEEIQAFEEAIYGKDVRAAMVSGAEKIQDEVNDAIEHQLIEVDDTLTVQGAGADAAVVGAKLDKAYVAKGALPSGTTLLSNYQDYGWYGIAASLYSGLQDLPDDFDYTTGGSILRVESTSLTANRVQTLMHVSTGSCWTRFIIGDTIESWKHVYDPRTKKAYISYNPNATTIQVGQLSVYLPVTYGYIEYRLRHYQYADRKCDGWQVYNIYWRDEKLSNTTELSEIGEWECAFRATGWDNFVGGFTHGFELMDGDAILYLDGKVTPISSTALPSSAGVLSFKELRLVQTSTMYDRTVATPSSASALAKHGREWVFADNKLTVNQSLKWLAPVNLVAAYMAMFLPLKTRIDAAYTDADYNLLTLNSTNYSITVPGAKRAVMYGNNGGIRAEVSVPIYPTGLNGGDVALFTDNTDKAYDKLYFTVCGNQSVSAGDLWRSQTVYDLDYIEPTT